MDDYCVTDECHCEQVHAACIEIVDDEEEELPIFEATVVPRNPQTLRLESPVIDRALAEKIWAAFAEEKEFYARLARRQDWMRTFGTELCRRWRVSHEPVVQGPKPAPNQACPCGSGKKYKRCCGR